jgi:hypothetical protein
MTNSCVPPKLLLECGQNYSGLADGGGDESAGLLGLLGENHSAQKVRFRQRQITSEGPATGINSVRHR